MGDIRSIFITKAGNSGQIVPRGSFEPKNLNLERISIAGELLKGEFVDAGYRAVTSSTEP